MWAVQRLKEDVDANLWLAELENPLDGQKRVVSPKVVEEEMAIFMRAKSVLSPGA